MVDWVRIVVVILGFMFIIVTIGAEIYYETKMDSFCQEQGLEYNTLQEECYNITNNQLEVKKDGNH